MLYLSVRLVFLSVSRPVGMAWGVGEAGGGMMAFALATGSPGSIAA